MVSRDELPEGIRIPESFQQNDVEMRWFREGFYDALENKQAKNWENVANQEGFAVSEAYGYGYKEGLRYKVVGPEDFDE